MRALSCFLFAIFFLGSVVFLSAAPVPKIITSSDYCDFLNAVAKTDDYGLYDKKMGSDRESASIRRRGVPGFYQYDIIEGRGDFSVSYLTKLNLVRFCNWYHNGQPRGEQGPETTETGAYKIDDSGKITRSAQSSFFLPEEGAFLVTDTYKNALRSNRLLSSQMKMSSNEAATLAFPDNTSLKLSGWQEIDCDNEVAKEAIYQDAIIFVEEILTHGEERPLATTLSREEASTRNIATKQVAKMGIASSTQELRLRTEMIIPANNVTSLRDQKYEEANRELRDALKKRTSAISKLGRYSAILAVNPNDDCLNRWDYDKLKTSANKAHVDVMNAAQKIRELQQKIFVRESDHYDLKEESTEKNKRISISEILEIADLKEDGISEEELISAYQKASETYRMIYQPLNQEEAESHAAYMYRVKPRSRWEARNWFRCRMPQWRRIFCWK